MSLRRENMDFKVDESLINCMIKEMEDAFEIDENSVYRWESQDQDYPIPRITNVIKSCFNSEGLINWAASVGYKGMQKTKQSAAMIGSVTHKLIEDFLKTGVIGNPYDMMFSNNMAKSAETAFNNFISWYEKIGCPIEVEASELQLTCPYCGGTADLVCKVNGIKYILDWKTSNYIRTEYFIQTAAYMWIYNNFYNPADPVQGIGVIRLSKKAPREFEDLIFNTTTPDQAASINSYIQGFLSCLNWYYNQNYVEYINNWMSMKDLVLI